VRLRGRANARLVLFHNSGDDRDVGDRLLRCTWKARASDVGRIYMPQLIAFEKLLASQTGCQGDWLRRRRDPFTAELA
jgi:hypothetical protein